ncbi:MAG: DUF3520 domain-containing protein [Aureispira sp.]|nr:DUF3520 domain-containing protein [Aureispira sp.]
MNKLLIILCSLLCYSISSTAQTTGSLQGKVIEDETGEGLPFANILLKKDSIAIKGCSSDFDGNYSFSNIPAGTYMLEVSCIGYPQMRMENVRIKVGEVVRVDLEMVASGIVLEEVIVESYDIPLIESSVSGGQTISSEDIRKMPTRSVNSIIAFTAGVNQADAGEAVNSNGSRKRGKGVRKERRKLNKVQRKYGRVERMLKKQYTEDEMQDMLPGAPGDDLYAVVENQYQYTKQQPLSTFGIDVDRASYSNIRQGLKNGYLPRPTDVRIEEMINYFNYDYEQPKNKHPFAVHTEFSDCIWNKKAKLLSIGLKGRELDLATAPANNIVFLIDVSGSMSYSNKLPLVKSTLELLTKTLRTEDKVAIVVYAGAAGEVLPSTSGADKTTILEALDRLNAGGSTAGGAGIELAYKIAKDNFVKDGNNRVILASDGDFNVGPSSTQELENLISQKRDEGIFLTVLGYGSYASSDAQMETLADKGNGNYNHIHDIKEAKRFLIDEAAGTLYTIAKDVKLQLDFSSEIVKSYRLVGYENRKLQNKDFKNDKKDAGDLGAGHTVTALYEVVLHPKWEGYKNTPMATVKLRYKEPEKSKSVLFKHPIACELKSMSKASNNFKKASAVAGLGMLLRKSKFNKQLEETALLKLSKKVKDNTDAWVEFQDLVKEAAVAEGHASR